MLFSYLLLEGAGVVSARGWGRRMWLRVLTSPLLRVHQRYWSVPRAMGSVMVEVLFFMTGFQGILEAVLLLAVRMRMWSRDLL